MRQASGIPCALFLEGGTNAKLGQILPRERGVVSLFIALLDTLIACTTRAASVAFHAFLTRNASSRAWKARA